MTRRDEESMANYYACTEPFCSEHAHGDLPCPKRRAHSPDWTPRLDALVREIPPWDHDADVYATSEASRNFENARIADTLRNYYERKPTVPYSDEALFMWNDLEAILKGEE